MSHSSLLLAALLIVSPLAVEAQNAQPKPGTPAPPSSEAESPDLKRFNLDFPGGTPGALVAAISKAIGKNLNVIIPASHADTKLMAFKVEAVTVPQLFAAIQSASRREIPRVTSQPGRQKTVAFKTVGVSFGIAGAVTISNDTVWSFTSTEPTAEDIATLSASEKPEQVCQYFQLAPYLQDHTVEDITTAIQTGWKMLKVDPVPQLSFHQETKLLIAVGSPELVAQIPMVLQQLQLDGSAAVEKIAKWQAELTEIEAKKSGDWQKEALALREKIDRLAASQRARERIQNSPPSMPPIVAPRLPGVPVAPRSPGQ